MDESQASSPTPTPSVGKKPLCIVVIGMAGSGKSTFVNKLHSYLTVSGKSVYTVNLDPAVSSVGYPVNIDIRDTVKYKEVMKQFNLGPNGAIMTSLNLFSTRFDQVLDLMEKKADSLDYIIVDTPGQIEVFNWSASGQIILDSLSASFPTTTTYLVDTERCVSPITFMSNMSYACSIMYKTKLPFILTFNKIDVQGAEEAQKWMKDFSSYCSAVQEDGNQSYMAALCRSMSIAMEEFYCSIRSAGVSSYTGEGFEELVKCSLHEAEQEFTSSYLPFLEAQKEAIKSKRQALALKTMKALEKSREGEGEEEREEREELEKFRAMMGK